jgi:hypothetical protein
VRLWPGPAAWSDLLCDKLPTNMSHQQWRDWVSPDIPTSRCARGCPPHPTERGSADGLPELHTLLRRLRPVVHINDRMDLECIEWNELESGV